MSLQKIAFPVRCFEMDLMRLCEGRRVGLNAVASCSPHSLTRSLWVVATMHGRLLGMTAGSTTEVRTRIRFARQSMWRVSLLATYHCICAPALKHERDCCRRKHSGDLHSPRFCSSHDYHYHDPVCVSLATSGARKCMPVA